MTVHDALESPYSMSRNNHHEHFDRAKAILDATPLTEEELTYLATGALGEGPGPR